MVFLGIMRSFVNRFRNHDSLESFFEKFLEFLQKKKNTVNLKKLKISGKSNGRFRVVYVSVKQFSSEK